MLNSVSPIPVPYNVEHVFETQSEVSNISTLILGEEGGEGAGRKQFCDAEKILHAVVRVRMCVLTSCMCCFTRTDHVKLESWDGVPQNVLQLFVLLLSRNAVFCDSIEVLLKL